MEERETPAEEPETDSEDMNALPATTVARAQVSSDSNQIPAAQLLSADVLSAPCNSSASQLFSSAASTASLQLSSSNSDQVPAVISVSAPATPGPQLLSAATDVLSTPSSLQAPATSVPRAPASQLFSSAASTSLQLSSSNAPPILSGAAANIVESTQPTDTSEQQKTAVYTRPRRTGKSKAKEIKEYAVKFKGNNSEKWDGKVISVDAEWLEELYGKQELCPGRIVELPWEGKDGTSVGWRVMIVSLPDEESDAGKCKTVHDSQQSAVKFQNS